MGDLEVYIKCDTSDCNARSREIWTKTVPGRTSVLTFCGHHADRNATALQAQGFNPLEQEALTK